MRHRDIEIDFEMSMWGIETSKPILRCRCGASRRRGLKSSFFSRHRKTLTIYKVAAGHLETFLARQRERDRHVPAFVEREFRAFLDCLKSRIPIFQQAHAVSTRTGQGTGVTMKVGKEETNAIMLSRSSRIFLEGHHVSCCLCYVDGCVADCIQRCLRGHRRRIPAPQSRRESAL